MSRCPCLRGTSLAPLLPVLLSLLLPASAAAEVKDYAIRRMLMLRTGCTVTGLEVAKTDDGQDRFRATCENVAHYPDGVEILCPDTDDDRECRIVTAERTFPHLHHMKP